MANVLGKPTIEGYTAFLRNIVGVPDAALPDGSFAITLSFNIAMDIVSCWLNTIQPDIYTLAVYNLAADRLLYFCPDQPGQTFFTDLRGQNGLNLNAFVPGVIESSHDESTGQAFAVPESLRDSLQIMDLQNLRTPYGRAYLAYAQMLGPAVWGLT